MNICIYERIYISHTERATFLKEGTRADYRHTLRQKRRRWRARLAKVHLEWKRLDPSKSLCQAAVLDTDFPGPTRTSQKMAQD